MSRSKWTQLRTNTKYSSIQKPVSEISSRNLPCNQSKRSIEIWPGAKAQSSLPAKHSASLLKEVIVNWQCAGDIIRKMSNCTLTTFTLNMELLSNFASNSTTIPTFTNNFHFHNATLTLSRIFQKLYNEFRNYKSLDGGFCKSTARTGNG